MTEQTFFIENMSCVNCRKIITSRLSDMDGVLRVKAKLPLREIHVEYDSSKVAQADIIQMLNDLGYIAARKENGNGAKN